MRILHVAPYLSETGAYGGPIAVAEDACRGLTEQGLDVTLLVGWDGRAAAPQGPFPTVRRRAWFLVPRRFPTAFAPGMALWLVRHVRRFDLVHVHATRELNMLTAIVLALLARRPVVLQTHGMIQPHRSRGGRLLDRVLTRHLLHRARRVLALTEREADGVRQVAPRARVERLGNPAPRTDLRAEWSTGNPTVVFLSRLHARKRPLALVQAAALVARERPDVRVDIWGADEGELPAVRSAIASHGLADSCTYRGTCARSDSLGILARAQVFVLPSVDEPFPMAALESFAVGLPAVLTTQTGVSAAARDAGAAVLTDGSPDEIAAAVLLLLGDRDAWERASSGGVELAKTRYASEAVAAQLVEHYRLAAG